MMYRQCRLRIGKREQVSFIPEEFCKVGKHLELRGENGWRVEWVASRRISVDYLREFERQYFGSIA